MDVVDLTSGKDKDLIGSESEGMERRVDDSKLAGASVDGVGDGETTMVDKGEEQQVGMPLPASGIFPGVATPPVVGQVIPVVDQAMDKRKRGRPPRGYVPKLPAPKIMKVEEEDVCFICFDGGSLVLCDRKGCPKAYHPACIKRDEAFFQSTARWDCGWHICSVCQKASHHFCYTCTYSLCKKCTKDSKYVSVKGNKGFCSTCMETIMMIENKDAGNNDSIQVDFDDKGSWEYLFKVYWVLLKKKLSLTLNDLTQAKNPWKGVIVTDFKPQLPVKINVAEDIAPSPPSEQSEPLILPEQNQVPDQNSEKRKISEGCMDWATQELLEFVAHMKNGDTSVLSQFDVQALLMEYIKVNNLRNPHQKSQILCDSRLKSLFGKPRVGHIEMLKLLEYHYLITEDTAKNTVIPAGIVSSASNVSTDNSNYSVLNRSKKQKARKKSEEKLPQVNLDDYAAIDVHNIKLIFLRRNMIENLLDQVEMFDDKVVGSIVRIRVSTNDQKQDIYRLVQVVGTSKGGESYKIGEKTTDIMLEVLNLDKKEMMSIVGISNQEFSEEECRRLRQSIKCGLVKRLTVGEVQSKAIALQALRFDDWLVAEILRLSYLRDRANEKGHKKELRECVEKLQVLKTPEERQRKLTEIPEVHADPKMNPNYESEEDTRENDMKQDEVSRRDHSKLGNIGSQVLRPKKCVKEDDIDTQRMEKKSDEYGSNCFPQQENPPPSQPVLRTDSERPITPSVSQTSSPNIQTEKIWHYRDPNGKIQGPFSITQLQKWSTTGYFPEKMSIWTDHVQFSDNPFLLSDVLADQQFSKRISPEPARETLTVTDNRHCDSENMNSNNNNTTVTQMAETEDLLVLETSGQNRPPVLNLDLNSGDCNIASVPNPNPNPNPNLNDSTEHSKVNLDLVELPSPTPKTETKKLEINPNEQESVFMDIQAAEMLRSLSSAYVPPTNGKTVSDVPSPKPKPMPSPKPMPIDVKTQTNPDPPEPSNETHVMGQSSGPLEFSLKDLGWTNTCGQDSAEPLCKEWDFGLVPMSSLKPTETNDGSNSDSNLPFHPLPNMSSWPLGIHEPIEFTTLAEESVSDLLAEVDAMESQIGMGPTSPSSAMRYGDGNDCFSSIEELSPNTDASKSDAISFPSQQAESDDHSIGASQIDSFDPVKRTEFNSIGKTESSSYPINIWENNRSDIPPPPPPPMNQAMINGTSHNWPSVQGNMGWAGPPPPPPPQAFVDQWRPNLNPTSSWANPNLSLGSYNGNPGWDNSPHRFTGSRDWQFQGGGGDMGFGRGGGGGDMGFGRGGGGGRPMWNRQQHGGGSSGGGGGGGYSRGQRVCKFYESGHCKKGASCGYLHP